ncbi:NAD-dependent epimerase/dehydratase family protein [Candidatus Pacearchaeota archaeon]|nr:NAD-dependent epimerase/dehydratase family protein [Candidatus Pacearchaeota archaeon]
MKVLVTGGSGFIGANFIKYLLEDKEAMEVSNQIGINVINLDKLTYAASGRNIEYLRLGEHKNYKFIHGDISDKILVDKVLSEEKPEIIFNFAAESHVDRSIVDADAFRKTNLEGTGVLIDSAMRHGKIKFIQISTDEVYGSLSSHSSSSKETDAKNPRSFYSATKSGAEDLALAAFATHNLPVIITRSSNNYGPFQFPEKILPLFITNLIDGKKVPLMWSEQNPGLNVRDWLHVEDNCRAIWLISQKGKLGEVYNIPGNNELTNMEITMLLLGIFGKKEDMIEKIPHRLGHDFRYSIDGAKLKTLGFYYKTRDFKKELEFLVDWYKNNKSWWEPLRKNIVGVKIKEIKIHQDKPDRDSLGAELAHGELGNFREILRFNEGFLDKIEQVSFGKTPPETIKAFHWHKNQDDVFYLIKGKILVVLYDLRQDSQTKGQTQEIILSEDSGEKAVLIPRGVLHGYKVLGKDTAEVLYLTNNTYDVSDPDEQRVPYDDKSIGFDWNKSYEKQKVAIIGASGSLGRKLAEDFSKDFEVVGTYNSNEKEGLFHLDITNELEVSDFFNAHKPDIAIICSAMTNVEECELSPDLAKRINVGGIRNIILQRPKKIIFFSTDAVFDGEKREYFEDDLLNPVNFYGRTKSEAEKIVASINNHLIIRTSRLYGVSGQKFVNTIINNLIEGRQVKSPADTKGNLTFIDDLSNAVLSLVNSGKSGIYHLAGDSYSFYDAANKIAEIYGFDKSLVEKVDKTYFDSKVNRVSVVLNTDKAARIGIKVRPFSDVLISIKDYFLKREYRHLDKCRFCGSKDFFKYLNLGKMPLVNELLIPSQSYNEKFFPLEVVLCKNCYLSQLSVVVDPSLMFRNYVYRSSVSNLFKEHCNELASDLNSRLLGKNDLVVDIASNDGCLLMPFKERGNRVLGVDPAVNLAKIANESGIETLSEFWSEKLANEIMQKYGKAKLITAFNVFAHVDDVHSFLEGIKILLDDGGFFIFESPHIYDLIDKTEFDTIYHEHLSYLSLKPIKLVAESHGLRVARAEKHEIHGGSIRVYIEHGNNNRSNGSVDQFLEAEEKLGVYSLKYYEQFKENVELIKIGLSSIVKRIKNDRKSVSGFGASAKGNILLNYCDLNKNHIDWVFDHTPEKQGKLTPGTNIPIIHPDSLVEKMPDYLLITAWNFAKEIMDKTKAYKEKGGKYIIPIPYPKIV